MICRLFASLFHINWRPPLTRESDSWLDELLAREHARTLHAHICQHDTATGAPRLNRLSDVLYPMTERSPR